MKIGIDLDGVGYVFGESVRDYLKSIGMEVGAMTDDLCKSWNFYEQWKMTREDFSKHCDAGVDAGFIFGPGDHLTRPGFFEAIERIKRLGHEVIIVTHRFQGTPGMAEKNTYDWLASVLPFVDEIHFSHDKTSIKTDMFVEDNLANYDALKAAGVDAYLINRPWNAPYDDTRIRINDISDFADEVEDITQRLSMV